MNRDQLEAMIWRHWPTRGPQAGTAVDAILAAADAYAAATVGEFHRSRTPPPAPVVHWHPAGRPDRTAACHGRVTQSAVTRDPRAVTCGTCKQTRAWRAAHEKAAA